MTTNVGAPFIPPDDILLDISSSGSIQLKAQTQGDIIVGGAAGVMEVLNAGAGGTYLSSDGSAVSWSTVGIVGYEAIPATLKILADTWSDNLLTGRTETFSGSRITSFSAVHDGKNTYLVADASYTAPTWTNGSGTTASGGSMVMAASTSNVTTPLLSSGDMAFEFTFTPQSTPASGILFAYLNWESDATYTGQVRAGTTTIGLYKTGNTQLISGAYTVSTSAAKAKWTREGNNHELFLNDVSVGTASDSTTVTLTKIKYANTYSEIVHINDFSVVTL